MLYTSVLFSLFFLFLPDTWQLWLSHVGKIGYGTVSEALAYKLPFVFVRRDYFNEEPFLRNMLEVKTSLSITLHKWYFRLYKTVIQVPWHAVLYALLSLKKQHYQCGIEMIRRDLLTGHWKPYLLRALTLKPCYDRPINGGEVIYFPLPGAIFVNVIWKLN